MKNFIQEIKSGKRVSFSETMTAINEHYIYKPVKFTNGLGDNKIVNAPGTNEGSCKIFALGKLLNLSQGDTLTLFGELYWKDVLENPDGTDHPNIRNFMKDGWKGITLYGEALKPRG